MIPERHGALIVLIAMAGALLAAACASDPAHAMPGFARKYRFSCTTCHAPFPRLKDFANDFAGRGFRLEDPEQEPKRAVHDVGDPLLTLFREIPLGMRLEGFAAYKEGATAETDFEFPWTWKIISGSPIGKTASYYFYFLVERGHVEGLEDAYIQLNDVFGSPITFLLGQFQVSDPMFKREARLTRADYEIYRTRVADSSLNLTYDRGIVLGWDFPLEIPATFQVVNGNGIPGADGDRNFDNDKYKNVALHVQRDFAMVNVGLFGYWGRQQHANGNTNDTWYFGPNFTIPFGSKIELNGQYLERRDDNPMFNATKGAQVETRGGFAELHVFPQGQDGRWAITPLYNKVDSDDGAAKRDEISVTLNYLLARNLRLLVEGGYDIEYEKGIALAGLIAGI
jgi:hypothetical protein